MNHEIAQKIADAVLEHQADYRTAHSGKQNLADVIYYAWLSAKEEEYAAEIARLSRDASKSDELLKTMIDITTMRAKP